MNAPDASHLEDPAAVDWAAITVRNTLLALVGLVVGAIVGLVIAGYAGWIPPLNMC